MLLPGLIWQEGPAWLKLAQSNWPVTPISLYQVSSEEIFAQLSNYYKISGQTFIQF